MILRLICSGLCRPQRLPAAVLLFRRAGHILGSELRSCWIRRNARVQPHHVGRAGRQLRALSPHRPLLQSRPRQLPHTRVGCGQRLPYFQRQHLRRKPYIKPPNKRMNLKLSLNAHMHTPYAAANDGSPILMMMLMWQELFQFVQIVVNAIQANLQRLYDLGLRNVMVSNIFEGDCTPEFTYINGYTKCTGAFGPFEQIHNAFLLGVVQSLNAHNPGARFIILDQYSAFAKIIATAKSDGFSMVLTPCCPGITPAYYCANVDPKTNRWLYTVCKRREKAIFWDDFHPTMWAWHYIINLYWYEPGYILLANEPTLQQWLGFIETAPEPVPAPLPSPSNDPPIPSTFYIFSSLTYDVKRSLLTFLVLEQMCRRL